MAQGKISAKQQEILEYIKSQILERGFPPSVRDICEAVHLKSTSSVHSHLETLEKNGYIRRDPTKPRAIEILDDTFNFNRREMVNVPIVGRVAAGEPQNLHVQARVLKLAFLFADVAGQAVGVGLVADGDGQFLCGSRAGGRGSGIGSCGSFGFGRLRRRTASCQQCCDHAHCESNAQNFFHVNFDLLFFDSQNLFR